MDLDNDYYIVKFQAKVDSEKALVEGLMVVYSQYQMVKLPCIPGVWYKKCLLEVVESTIGQVLRVDDNTENGYRGCFARMIVCVDFRRPLITKIKEGHLKTRAKKATECNKKETNEQRKMSAAKQPSTKELDR
ncbi:hypothetical protein GOBAR_AA10153 [Gossypium barbadense]|uniref:DUF4283 domain-containing protein n=1 Tax=Gossypium barbadense TaxID=3634 RepID=A0A2P5Y4E9_GOSBA|nr:hypothetical protein GOBAR_AA10153 [Gossypium barbadense]